MPVFVETTPEQKPPAPSGVLIAADRRGGRRVSAASGLYALLILAILGAIRWVGGDWWGAVALLFVPRWLLLAPLPLLALLSLWTRNRGGWIVQGATALVILGPVMGLGTGGLLALGHPPRGGNSVNVVSFNLGMDPIRAEDFRAWIDHHRIDIVCFQEGGREGDPIRKSLSDSGWHLSRRRTVASRFPIVEELPPFPEESESDERYTAALERVRLQPPKGPRIVVASVHLPTLRPGIEHLLHDGGPAPLTRHRAWWSHELSRVLSSLAEAADSPMIVAGDFNMPSDDATMAALRANFRFAFDEKGLGYGYTRPARYPWVRIDHIMTDPDWQVLSCHVGPDFGSDHRPIRAELALPGS